MRLSQCSRLCPPSFNLFVRHRHYAIHCSRELCAPIQRMAVVPRASKTDAKIIVDSRSVVNAHTNAELVNVSIRGATVGQPLGVSLKKSNKSEW